MKKLGWAIVIVLLLVAPLNSAQETIEFNWNANTEPDLAGYKLYVGNKTNMTVSEMTLVKTVPKTETTTSAPVSGSEGQTVYFVLTAYDTAGNESEPSNECPFTFEDTAPASPGGFTCSKQEAQ